MTEFKTPLLIWLPWKHWKPQKCRPVLIIPKGLNHAYVIPGTTSTSTFEEDSVYDQQDAEGFIKLNALRLRLAAKLKN